MPTVITWVRTNRIQRPSREKRGASSLRSLAGGVVSRRTVAPLGESSQIERCWIPNCASVVRGPAAAASTDPDGAQVGETQLRWVAGAIVR